MFFICMSTSSTVRDIYWDNIRVVCLETRKIYENAKEAAKDTGADSSTISKCCKGIFRHSKGYHWMYEKDYLYASEDEINLILYKPRKQIESIRIKEVICLETKEIFNNIKEAAKSKKACEANISRSCKCPNGQPSLKSGGYHWMFLEDYKKSSPEEIEMRLHKRSTERKKRKK